MKVFVSQPHKGRPWKELEKTSDEIVGYIRDLYPEENVIEVPMLKPDQFKGQHPVYYLGMNLQMMCQADIVVFVPGWWESRACCTEHDVCEQYGIEHMDIRWGLTRWS